MLPDLVPESLATLLKFRLRAGVLPNFNDIESTVSGDYDLDMLGVVGPVSYGMKYAAMR